MVHLKTGIGGIIIFTGLSLIIIISSCKKVSEALNSKPVCTIIDPIQQVTMYKEDSILVTVSATDADGSISFLRFYIDNKLVFTGTEAPFRYKLKNIGFGYHNLSVIAYDDKEAASTPAGLSVSVISNPKVSVNLTAIPWPQNLLVGDTVLFTINAVSTEGNIRKAFIYIDDTLRGSSVTLPFAFSWNYLPLGSHKVYASAADEKGHEGMSKILEYSIMQNRPPVISISLIPIPSQTHFFPGSTISIECDAEDPDYRMQKVEYYINNKLLATVSGTSFYDYVWSLVPSGNWRIQAKAIDNQGAYGWSNAIDVVVSPGLVRNGVISDITATEDDHTVFAADVANKRLLVLDPVNHFITDSIELNHPAPIAIWYSEQDHTLFMVYEFSGILTQYNRLTHQMADIVYSASEKGLDVVNDDINRRIYVLTKGSNLVVINQDDGTVIQSGLTIDGESMALDPVNRWLFTAQDYYSNIKKYSIANDVLQQLQTKYGGENQRKITINRQGTTVVLPCGGGNKPGGGYELYAFDASDLNNIKGKWNVGTWPSFAVFSNDGRHLFCLNGDEDKIYMESVSNFSTEQLIDFPLASGHHSLIIPNHSATHLTGFSYDEMYNQRYVIYFFDL